MNYRREIDGLRSIALLPVVLFHAGFTAFTGGFVGVDIFFVISGYLITSIILTEQQDGSFTLRGFYSRRVRRILPALYFVLLISSIACLFVLSPFDGRDFWQSLSATIPFVSNILFLVESSDYFGLASEYKPLLHTWSLAVEEQYYVLYPLILLAAWRFGTKWVVALLVMIAAFSLAAAQWSSYNNPVVGFFMLPTRGWELLIGAFVAFYLSKNKICPVEIIKNKLLYEVSGTIGLLMVLSSVLFFNKSTPIPSIFALLPTLGTALVILFATPQTFVGRLLGSNLLVGIGLISYSAYLWHQPLFAFARYYLLSDLSVAQSMIVISLTFCLATLTWKFIEQPCRSKMAVSNGVLFSILSVVSFILFSMGVMGHLSKGYQNIKLSFLADQKRGVFVDFFSELIDKEKIRIEISKKTSADFSKDSRKKVLILGDSLSGDFMLAVSLNENLLKGNEFVRRDLDDLLMGQFLEYLMKSDQAENSGLPLRNFHNLKNLVANSNEIVLAASWDKATLPLALRLAEYLEKVHKKIYVVDALKIFHMSASSFYFANSDISASELNHFMYKRLSSDYMLVRNDLNRYFLRQQDLKLNLIDKAEFFCNFGYATCTLYSNAGRPLIFDELHLTVAGIRYFGDRLEKAGYFAN